jgi:hypothetical protein
VALFDSSLLNGLSKIDGINVDNLSPLADCEASLWDCKRRKAAVPVAKRKERQGSASLGPPAKSRDSIIASKFFSEMAGMMVWRKVSKGERFTPVPETQ